MVLLCLWGILSAAGCRTASSTSQDSLEQERRYKQILAAAQREGEERLTAKQKAEEARRAKETLEAKQKAETAAQAGVKHLARLGQETQRRQNEEARRLEQQLEKAWKAKQAALARRQAQSAHRAQAPTPTKRMIEAFEITQQVYHLQCGDEVEISVWGHPDLNVKTPIREDGTFSFPLIGQVEAVGRSLKEVEQSVRDRLGSDYIVNPQVTARLTGAKFSVFGEVQNPGSYPIEGSMDLLTAISIAGGITKFGSNRVEVIRSQGNEKAAIRANLDRIVHGKEPNVNILPHDTVYVKRRRF